MDVLSRLKQHRRVSLGIAAALIVGALLQVTNTNPAVSQTLSLTAYEVPDDPGTDPDSVVWDKVASVKIPLTAQAGTYPAGGSVQTIRAQAVHHNGRIYIRVNWPDTTIDDSTTRVEDFSDAVALEFPASGTTAVPSICMGQADAAVNIWQWRADSNAGLRDPNKVYVNSLVDAYPYTNSLFYTAREAGNPYANPDLSPVQSLHSQAFGELTALNVQDVSGFGKHNADGWAVVFARDFATPNSGHAAFAASTRMDMAFAVWDGEKEERNGRKSVSQFVTLGIAAAPAFDEGGGNVGTMAMAAVLFLGVTAIGGGLAVYGYREGRR